MNDLGSRSTDDQQHLLAESHYVHAHVRELVRTPVPKAPAPSRVGTAASQRDVVVASLLRCPNGT